MPVSGAVYGCQGSVLAATERDFFRDVRPFGFILLAINGNIENPSQVAALCDQLRDSIGDANTPIFIDQEGGRVQRLKPPHWQARPAARRFGDLFARDPERGREGAYLCARLIAHDLRGVGVTVNCAPVLDVPVAGAHDIIGDRAYSLSPPTVAELGRAAVEGYLDGGVLPVIKHIPGHGRATVDSHLSLPRVTTRAAELSTHDFVPFRSLNQSPMGMTAHVVYEAIDPRRPATTSPKVIRDVIRGQIGFQGLLLTDDLSMSALEGSIGARTKAALFAGCDIVLHCNGKLDEMMDVAKETKPLAGDVLGRAKKALSQLRRPADFDAEEAEARLSEMLMGAVA
jgi:beta-N-acetylhexosaminidase